MANPPSRFEQLIANNWPVQTSVMRYLTRWDFRNLQLAGVAMSVSQNVQRKYQLPTRCDERDPENWAERCANTTESFDEIRACAGHPIYPRKETTVSENWQEARPDEPCLQNERFSHWGDNPNNEPNTSKYPIHSKICRGCRDFYAGHKANQQLLQIASFGRPLCQQHSLEHAKQFPLNACRCFDYVNDKWRCRHCCDDAMDILKTRCFLRNVTFNLNLPRFLSWTNFNDVGSLERGVWSSGLWFCPIDGCKNLSWDSEGETGRMQRCMACDAITRI